VMQAFKVYEGPDPDVQKLAALKRYGAELAEQTVRLDAIQKLKTDPAHEKEVCEGCKPSCRLGLPSCSMLCRRMTCRCAMPVTPQGSLVHSERLNLRGGTEHFCHLQCFAVSTYFGTLICCLELDKCGASDRRWRAAGPRCGAPMSSWTKQTAPSRRSRPESQHGCSRSFSLQRQAQRSRNRSRQPLQRLERHW